MRGERFKIVIIMAIYSHMSLFKRYSFCNHGRQQYPKGCYAEEFTLMGGNSKAGTDKEKGVLKKQDQLILYTRELVHRHTKKFIGMLACAMASTKSGTCISRTTHFHGAMSSTLHSHERK
jgi:hypothetical protein